MSFTPQLTPRWGLPYPELPDSADVPRDVEALALALDGVAFDDQGLYADRPASTTGTPGKKGRYYWATDQTILYRDHGTGWDPINTVYAVDGPQNVGTLRTLGAGHFQGCPGDDARLSDWRIPTAGSVDLSKAHAQIRPSMAAPSSGEALRALASIGAHGAGTAAPGTHAASHAPGGYDPISFTIGNSFGTRAARPSPGGVGDGIFYTATDQVALYETIGGIWFRVSPQVGMMAFLPVASAAGWVLMDGRTLDGSIPINAELFALLGTAIGGSGNNFVIPDGQGRAAVGYAPSGNADVNALFKNEGSTKPGRSPKHNTSYDMVVHTHEHAMGTGTADDSGGGFASTFYTVDANAHAMTPKLVDIDLAVGPGGTRPTDTPAFLTAGWFIKL